MCAPNRFYVDVRAPMPRAAHALAPGGRQRAVQHAVNSEVRVRMRWCVRVCTRMCVRMYACARVRICVCTYVRPSYIYIQCGRCAALAGQSDAANCSPATFVFDQLQQRVRHVPSTTSRRICCARAVAMVRWFVSRWRAPVLPHTTHVHHHLSAHVCLGVSVYVVSAWVLHSVTTCHHGVLPTPLHPARCGPFILA